MTKSYVAAVSKLAHNQKNPLSASSQVQNNTGGMVFEISPLAQFNRFLVLGSEQASFYVSEQALTLKALTNTSKILTGPHAVDAINEIVRVSEGGLAPKNAPAVYALAAAVHLNKNNLSLRKLALDSLGKVVRTASDLMYFVEQYKSMGGGFGASVKRALGEWYTSKTPDQQAYQLVKYRQRNGWTNHDIHHLIHIKPATDVQRNILAFAKALDNDLTSFDKEVPSYAKGFLLARNETNTKKLVQLITDYNLPREALPTDSLNSPEVWEALLQKMPATALIRNLGKMSAVGLFDKRGNANSKLVNAKLSDSAWLKKSRVHPISILSASKVYARGSGIKGSLRWNVDASILTNLDDAFYAAYSNVESTGKAVCIGLDISASMHSANVLGMEHLTAAEVAAAMSLVYLNVEKNAQILGFGSRVHTLDIRPNQRLQEVLAYTSRMNFGSTAPSLLFDWSNQNKKIFDAFIVITDNEINGGRRVDTELTAYKKLVQRNTKLAICATSLGNFSIADPNRNDMLDVCGFSADAPTVVNSFIIQ